MAGLLWNRGPVLDRLLRGRSATRTMMSYAESVEGQYGEAVFLHRDPPALKRELRLVVERLIALEAEAATLRNGIEGVIDDMDAINANSEEIRDMMARAIGGGGA